MYYQALIDRAQLRSAISDFELAIFLVVALQRDKSSHEFEGPRV